MRKRNTHPRNDLFRWRTRHWQYNISMISNDLTINSRFSWRFEFELICKMYRSKNSLLRTIEIIFFPYELNLRFFFLLFSLFLSLKKFGRYLTFLLFSYLNLSVFFIYADRCAINRTIREIYRGRFIFWSISLTEEIILSARTPEPWSERGIWERRPSLFQRYYFVSFFCIGMLCLLAKRIRLAFP